jgi:quercetin dioxygenase-like cupin family protein
MNLKEMEKYIVRYADLKPCKTAFIDAHTPGSDQKDNFTIIGPGVSESANQFVHISETPGFNIGAAGQPPKCFNSLHYHNTAEVFFVLKGRWRFFWGRYGEAGEVVLNEGDIFNIPTRVFRGFENIGDEYGMIMSVLGGDDSGGGVIWAPQVLDAASSHGLILSETGQLYDTKKGETLPHGQNPVSKLTDKDLSKIPEVPVNGIVRDYVARYWDLMALSKSEPCLVIGEDGLIKDRPGFEVEFIGSKSVADKPYSTNRYGVLMPVKGDWKLSWQGHETILNSGDTCLLKPGIEHSLIALDESESSLYRITSTDDSAGLTWKE